MLAAIITRTISSDCHPYVTSSRATHRCTCVGHIDNGEQAERPSIVSCSVNVCCRLYRLIGCAHGLSAFGTSAVSR